MDRRNRQVNIIRKELKKWSDVSSVDKITKHSISRSGQDAKTDGLNNAKKTRSRIGPLKNENSDVVTNPREQAQILNAHYGSVFTRMWKTLLRRRKTRR